MTKLALSASALALAAAAGCTTYYDPAPVPPVATTTSGTPVVSAASSPAQPGASRSVFGLIESISLVTLPAASASAGGTLPAAAPGPYRVTLRMDDGNIQTLVVDNRAFLVGDRVQVMPDGRLSRL